jgi:hypothetical protein
MNDTVGSYSVFEFLGVWRAKDADGVMVRFCDLPRPQVEAHKWLRSVCEYVPVGVMRHT